MKCVECGKEISDKSEICIHCGCPTKVSIDALKTSVDDKIDDNVLKEYLDNNKDFEAVIYVLEAKEYKISTKEARQYVDEYAEKRYIPSHKKKPEPDNRVKCPKCGCTDIGVVNRGYSFWTGFLGSGKPMNVCKKCGHKWAPP